MKQTSNRKNRPGEGCTLWLLAYRLTLNLEPKLHSQLLSSSIEAGKQQFTSHHPDLTKLQCKALCLSWDETFTMHPLNSRRRTSFILDEHEQVPSLSLIVGSVSNYIAKYDFSYDGCWRPKKILVSFLLKQQ